MQQLEGKKNSAQVATTAVQTLTKQLRKGLEARVNAADRVMFLIDKSEGLTIHGVLSAVGEPNFAAMMRAQGGKEKLRMMLNVINEFGMGTALGFKEPNITLTYTFSSDLMELEPTWKVLDVLMFWKWLRTSSVKLPYGRDNITSPVLNELRERYNEEVAAVREQEYYNNKNSGGLGTLKTKNKDENGLRVLMGAEYERIAAKNVEKGEKSPEVRQTHKEFFEPEIPENE